MALLRGPPLWFRLKQLINCKMDYHEIMCRHSWSPEHESPDGSPSATSRLTFMVLSELLQHLLDGIWFNDYSWRLFDIHFLLRMNCTDFDDPLTFHLAPSGLKLGKKKQTVAQCNQLSLKKFLPGTSNLKQDTDLYWMYSTTFNRPIYVKPKDL